MHLILFYLLDSTKYMQFAHVLTKWLFCSERTDIKNISPD